jgi:hypothetical protein
VARPYAATMRLIMTKWHRALPAFVAAIVVSACVVQPPQRTPPPGSSPPPEPPVETRPIPPPEQPSEPPEPVPAPVIREPVLSAASRALVGQAQAQLKARNFVVAASSVERALRIEAGNPLLWIELGKVRYAEGNYLQAENMGRKAVSLSNAPQASSAAWKLIAESLRARGKTSEAQAATLKAESLR